MLPLIKTVCYDTIELDAVLSRSQLKNEELNAAVAQIVGRVKREGDAALFEYTKKFDGLAVDKKSIRVTEEEIDAAYKSVDTKLLSAMRRAKAKIIAYQTRLLDAAKSGEDQMTDGVGYVVRPVGRAGIYVPGGKAAYPSSVMMAALTAGVAGVSQIIMATPAGKGINPLTLVAARECGVARIYKIGGAQAIAALAYGTESVEKCDTVTGPGNIYVALAKKLVYGDAGVDSIAGPSEILILADKTANPAFLAADMLSQAEHDELASAFLVTDDSALADAVKAELQSQLETLPKADIARVSLAEHSAVILVDDMKKGIDICNRIAPEHMEICTDKPERFLPLIQNAGAVFLGSYSPEPLGDYYAGPNHILPTSGAARFSSAMSVDCFIKKISVIRYSRQELFDAKDDIETLASTEGLDAHARSIQVRFK